MITLQRLCSAIVDCEHKTAPIDKTGNYFAVGTPAMRGNKIDLCEARRISAETFVNWTKRLRPREGDLLLAREAPVGPVVRIPPEENVAPGQRTVLLRPDPQQVTSEFLYYALSAPSTQQRLQIKASGSTVHHLNVADVRTFELPVPALPEQQAIAEVLGALDDKIAANGRLADQHHEVAATVYAVAVRGLDWVRMSELLTPILGGTPDRARADFWGGDAPWLSVKDVVNATAGVVIDTIEHITDEAIAQTKAKPLDAGSVILTARGTVGQVARLGAPASFNQSCYGFAPDRLPASVLYFAVRGAVEQIRQLVHGSVFDTITKSTFEHVQIPDFSDEAANAAEMRMRPQLDASESLARESRSLAALRDALLPELMSGRLRVKDAERAVEGAV